MADAAIVDGGVALVTDTQPPEVVQVRDTPLDHPALAAQAGAVPGPAASDGRPDASGPQKAAAVVVVVVVAAVGKQPVGLLAGSRSTRVA